MNIVSKKWERAARELFDLFSKEMTENGYTVKEGIHPIFHPKNIQEMVSWVSKTDVEDMIRFSVKNWESLKGSSKLKGLSQEPSFNQMLSQYKYPTLIECMKRGIEEKAEPAPEIAEDKSWKSKIIILS